MDTFTKEQRSHCMAQIKSKWTSCERRLHNYLKGNKISFRMHPKLEGNPDIFIPDKNLIIFVHGCFWHKCPKCYRKPSTNKEYWTKKVESNVRRDRKIVKKYKNSNFKIMIIWEHELKKDIRNVINKIIS